MDVRLCLFLSLFISFLKQNNTKGRMEEIRLTGILVPLQIVNSRPGFGGFQKAFLRQTHSVSNHE